MKKLDRHILCPACQGPLTPAVLICDPCGLKVEGRFTENEFASLGGDELHFLRIFIHCEGKIRDMEKALGVSYPSIKAKMARFKERLAPTPVVLSEAPDRNINDLLAARRRQVP